MSPASNRGAPWTGTTAIGGMPNRSVIAATFS